MNFTVFIDWYEKYKFIVHVTMLHTELALALFWVYGSSQLLHSFWAKQIWYVGKMEYPGQHCINITATSQCHINTDTQYFSTVCLVWRCWDYSLKTVCVHWNRRKLGNYNKCHYVLFHLLNAEMTMDVTMIYKEFNISKT